MRALLRVRERDAIALSVPVFDEISEVLHRPKFAEILSPNRVFDILELLTAAALWFEPALQVTGCPDPKDDKYLELAVCSMARVIVSSDRHLLAMHPWRGIPILRPAEYMLGP